MYGMIVEKRITMFLFVVVFLFVPGRRQVVSGEVLELTPELADTFLEQKTRRYFVKMDVGPCHGPKNTCQTLDKLLWEPFSMQAPNEVWTRLDCTKYRGLCNQLSTPERVQQVFAARRSVDFFTVAYSETSPSNRIVELYRAKSTNPDQAVQYYVHMVTKKLPLEPMSHDEIESHIQLNALSKERRKPVSLAVLVLTTDGFTRPDVWKAFSETGKDELRMFMHDRSGKGAPLVPNVIQVPLVFSHRGTIALVRPVIQMLRFALAYGGASHYVLVSGDSVPLLSAADMVKELSKSNQTRFERHVQDEFKVQMELRQPYKYEFRKSKNWIVLNHEAARFFADYDQTSNFDILSMADEYYWINVAQEFNISWAHLPVMYDVWPSGVQAERPKNLLNVHGNQLRSNGHLFARKINQSTELILDWMTDDSTGASSLDEF